MEQVSYAEAIVILNSWRRSSFFGLKQEDVRFFLSIVKNKLDSWETNRDKIDELYQELGNEILTHVGRIILEEGFQEAVNRRY